MSHEYYHLCRDSIGAEVEIRDCHGKVYVGTIDRVDPDHVYLRPIGPCDHGHGMYFFAGAALTAIAFASIVAFRFRRRRHFF
ncbi:hypothetical protein [Alteribacter populi]|uniref:hypothetical protein n=1 Tax=Alteribacter populi TaxID=2011011 RepID=UPI000BBB3B1E|nr:hypothetical protein [Alteribacter populi]